MSDTMRKSTFFLYLNVIIHNSLFVCYHYLKVGGNKRFIEFYNSQGKVTKNRRICHYCRMCPDHMCCPKQIVCTTESTVKSKSYFCTKEHIFRALGYWVCCWIFIQKKCVKNVTTKNLLYSTMLHFDACNAELSEWEEQRTLCLPCLN